MGGKFKPWCMIRLNKMVWVYDDQNCFCACYRFTQAKENAMDDGYGSAESGEAEK